MPPMLCQVYEVKITHDSVPCSQVQDEDDIMICQCREPTFGGEGCGPNCLNYMLNIECVPVRSIGIMPLRARPLLPITMGSRVRLQPAFAACVRWAEVPQQACGVARRATARLVTIATIRCSRGGREQSWRR